MLKSVILSSRSTVLLKGKQVTDIVDLVSSRLPNDPRWGTAPDWLGDS
jgi:hypothetical protein